MTHRRTRRIKAAAACLTLMTGVACTEPAGDLGDLSDQEASEALAQAGLQGEYFGNQTLSGTAASRVDPVLDFTWGAGAPMAGIGADWFSVRWTGTVTPAYSEAYTLRTLSDDGIRVWIDARLVIDNWTPHAATSNAATVQLTAGRPHAIRVEYFERSGQATMRLLWSSAHQPEQVIPSSALRPPGGAPPPLRLAAFPGAEGAGASATGGRGGAVFQVSNLADSGAGSLRACVEASGPRTCVFTVGGTIPLKTALWISSPNLTVAGQTAPGGGIQLTNAPGAVISNMVGVAAGDVVWRYTRLRNQYRAACADGGATECGALFTVFSGVNTMFDHNSLSWNQDEGIGVWSGAARPLRALTASMNLIAEGLASHPTGVIVGGSNSALSRAVTDIDLHHNLVMNNGHRNPLLKGGSARVVNNLFYNQDFYVTQVGGGNQVDVIGNHYRKGPMNGAFHELQAFAASGTDAADGTPSLFVAGNLGWNQPSATADQTLLARQVSGENGNELGAVPASWFRATAMTASAVPISVDGAGAVAGAVLPTVGASRRLGCDGSWSANRDRFDTEQVRQYVEDDGLLAPRVNETQAGGLPALASGAACADGDRDGMPDVWEAAHGLSSQDAADRNVKRPNAAGYTNLELYLSGLFPGSVPLP